MHNLCYKVVLRLIWNNENDYKWMLNKSENIKQIRGIITGLLVKSHLSPTSLQRTRTQVLRQGSCN